jgi:hypothetical protein
VAKLGTGSDLPYRMAVHPGGDGLVCSFPKSCRYSFFLSFLWKNDNDGSNVLFIEY